MVAPCRGESCENQRILHFLDHALVEPAWRQLLAELGEIAAHVFLDRPADGERSRVADVVPDPGFRDRFLFWYLTEYCVRTDDIATMKRKIRALLDNGARNRNGVSGRAYRYRLYAYSLADRLRKRLF